MLRNEAGIGPQQNYHRASSLAIFPPFSQTSNDSSMLSGFQDHASWRRINTPDRIPGHYFVEEYPIFREPPQTGIFQQPKSILSNKQISAVKNIHNPV
jgi:hypothetical protein